MGVMVRRRVPWLPRTRGVTKVHGFSPLHPRWLYNRSSGAAHAPEGPRADTFGPGSELFDARGTHPTASSPQCFVSRRSVIAISGRQSRHRHLSRTGDDGWGSPGDDNLHAVYRQLVRGGNDSSYLHCP